MLIGQIPPSDQPLSLENVDMTGRMVALEGDEHIATPLFARHQLCVSHLIRRTEEGRSLLSYFLKFGRVRSPSYESAILLPGPMPLRRAGARTLSPQ